MAYNSENTIQGNSCIYNTTDPYALFVSSMRQYPYSEAISSYSQGTMLQRQANHFLSSYSLYPQSYNSSYKYQENDVNSFLNVYMTTGGRPDYQGNTTAMSMANLQLTTNYSRLLDASDPVKSHKQVHPFYWRKRGNSAPAEGMTRTKDKYRVVYTEKQRIGLEKEFKANKFITMKTKTRLSKELDLSERQIKIWFQNRRAKERRQRRKADTEKEDRMISEQTSDDSIDSSSSHENTTVTDDKIADVGFSSHNYPALHALEEPRLKTQCRFQQTGSHDNGAAQAYYHGQSERRFSTSPTEWCQTAAPLTQCNVSPFTTNPDWNLIYRS